MDRIWKVLTRRKAIDPITVEETRLNRVLNIFDLTALGVGSTLGVGVYILAGEVAHRTAGPSVILSLLIAAIASVFAGLCYAEFGARAPRAGSAYIYSYVCVGEFIAFIIGWNLILEYVIGSASVARGLSLYLDILLNNTLQDAFKEIAPINIAYLASYFDFFSFGISILLAIALAFGLKESSLVNNVVTCLNVCVVLFVIIAGSLHANLDNWRITPNNTNVTNSTIIGDGGFFPWGVEGMIKGAATCFYGFVGFDCIATTGEEVKNPRRAIPISIIVSLFIIFLAYFGIATVLTLMVPYYLENVNAPIPKAFEFVGWDWAKWIVSIGALFGLCASLFGAMFPLPRIIYAMGSDGLIFRFLSKVNLRFGSPVTGTLLSGCLTGLMAALFDLTQLVNMMSIGTLQAYTIVAASVLLLRYKEEAKRVYVPIKTSSDTESVNSESSNDERYNDDGIRQNFDGPSNSDEQQLISEDSSRFSQSLKYVINCSIKEPTRITENIVAVEVFLYCILCVGIGLCVIYMGTEIIDGEMWALIVTSVIVGLAIFVLFSLVTQPKSKKELSFKVPLVPLVPALSILVNIYLMLMLDYRTWIRFAVWMAIGIPMYYICACVQKPLAASSSMKAQNGLHYTTNITINGNSKSTSALGLSNPSFAQDEPEVKRQFKKKLAPAPPATIFEQNESTDAQHEAAIAQLDEILENEEAIGHLDLSYDNSSRKLSEESLPNVASRPDDVVEADVHCEDVLTPVADPVDPMFPVLSLNSNTSIERIENQSFAGKSTDNFSALNQEDINEEGKTDSKIQKDIDEENDEVKPITAFDISGEVSSIEEAVVGNTEEQNDQLSTKEPSDFVVPMSPPISNENTFEIGNKKEEPESNKILYDNPITVPISDKEALKTVRLRHVNNELKKIEPVVNENASDDNLKTGSEEYKSFVENLNDVLKRPVVPSYYYVAPKKPPPAEPKEILPNENVIEDNINQAEVKEMLTVLYANRQELRVPLNTSKSVNESRLHNANNQTKEDSLQDHKKKMENVFNSIRLKKLDNEDMHSKRRLSKSLGSSFVKDTDDTDHKRNMENIFKNIKALRKEPDPE
ncbi:hypothetical protein ABEB36_012406 [Hypothenemus hampei]|uniref:Cationic amino acid transporter C-terminal domain-containing protein n=1 Tax=Hypothenemus hampei TaxID=57062 RepID=A0ABD1EB42_HYPHA